MSLWERLNSLPVADQIKTVYSESFPIEIRELCAVWIEEQINGDLCNDINDPQYCKVASNFISNLVQQLNYEKTRLRPGELVLRNRIDCVQRFFTQNLCNPEPLYKHIRDILHWEKHFLDSYNNDSQTQVDTELHEINERIKKLREMITTNIEYGNRYRNELENFMLQYNKRMQHLQMFQQKLATNKNDEIKNQFEKLGEHYKAQTVAERNSINAKCHELCNSIVITMQSHEELQNIVIHKRLHKWQQSQVLAGNGGELPLNGLDQIQQWFEALADIIWSTRTLIDSMRSKTHLPCSSANFNELFEDAFRNINRLLQNLILSSFIVEKQPPQVMKTNTRFAATVRLLLANLSIHLNNPSVKVSVLSEEQIQTHKQNFSSSPAQTSGEIINNSGHLEFQQATRCLTCNLENMQIKKIKRSKKNAESVTEEKFALLFKSKFQMADMQFNVWVLSVPVVVIVHGNQEPQSWATITWDNAFSDINRIPFSVVEQVPWSKLAEALNMKFISYTGRGLTDENLSYLYEKVSGKNANCSPDIMITRSQFSKDMIPCRPFTFWDWFYAFMKLARDDLCGPWVDGYIIGFIRKNHAEEMLLNCRPGTFLLRFSDSAPGGITIAWVAQKPNQMPHIVMLKPFEHKDLGMRSLADRINDLDQCVYLYPDIPKETAFEKYYTKVDAKGKDNGYKETVLIMTMSKDDADVQECCSDSSSSSGPHYATLAPPSVSTSNASSPEPFGSPDTTGYDMITSSSCIPLETENIANGFEFPHSPDLQTDITMDSCELSEFLSYLDNGFN